MTAAIGGVFIVFVKTRAGNNTFAVNCNKKTTEIQYNILAYSMYLNIILKTKKKNVNYGISYSNYVWTYVHISGF